MLNPSSLRGPIQKADSTTNPLRITTAHRPLRHRGPSQVGTLHLSLCLLPSSEPRVPFQTSQPVSSMTVPLPPTTNDLDIKEKLRLLRQTRKLSQIFGELPREDTVQPHPARCNMNMPAVEGASTDHPQQRQQHIRFSRHSLIDLPSRSFRFPLNSRSAEASVMSPSSSRVALGQSNPTRPLPVPPSHIGQLDSARFSLGRLSRARSTGSSHENAQRASPLSIVENKPTRSSSLRTTNHLPRPKDRSRRRTADTSSLQTHTRRSADIFTPTTHSQRRSVSLWARRRMTKGDLPHQQRTTADQNLEHNAPVVDAHPPLTEAQKTQSIRRGRKLAQV